MMWWPEGTMTGWGWAAMTISMVLFWVVLILGGVLLYRAVGRSPGGGAAGPERPTPQQLLAERYARGELTDEEYRRALDTLRDSGALTR